MDKSWSGIISSEIKVVRHEREVYPRVVTDVTVPFVSFAEDRHFYCLSAIRARREPVKDIQGRTEPVNDIET